MTEAHNAVSAAPKFLTSLGGQFLGSDSDAIPQLFVRKIILAQQVDGLMCCQGITEPWATAFEKHLPARGMEGLLARSCRNRNGANERESSTKGSTESLGILAQTVSTARHGATTLWGRLFGRTRENMLPEQTSAVRASSPT